MWHELPEEVVKTGTVTTLNAFGQVHDRKGGIMDESWENGTGLDGHLD